MSLGRLPQPRRIGFRGERERRALLFELLTSYPEPSLEDGFPGEQFMQQSLAARYNPGTECGT